MNSFTGSEIIVTAFGILIGLYIPPSLTTTTIGLEQTIRTVNEPDGPVRLCASVMASTSSNYEININVVYQDRSATDGSDFEETPYSFLFTPNETRHCFDVVIIDNNIYEVRQEFFVNITNGGMDSSLTLSPHFTTIRIDDDDRVTIGWEHKSYTVREADGHLDVCARFNGILESTLPQSRVTVEQGTAIENQDFRFSPHTTLNFPKGSTFGSILCFQVTILKDIAYEGEKNFSLVISQTITERLTIAPQRTTVIIKDHNAITKQQPSSGCEGISNLINSSSTVEICGTEDSTSSEFCDVLTCSTSDWSLALSFQGCYREVMLNVTDKRDNVSIYEVFPSKEQLQELNHTLGNQTGIISLTSRVVASDHKMYYLVTLDSPLFNISFPVTAIPVECPISDPRPTSSISPTTLPDTPLESSPLGAVVGGAVGGVIVAFLVTIFVILLMIVSSLSRRSLKKTNGKRNENDSSINNKRTTDFIVTETNVSYSPVREMTAGDNYDYIAEDLIQTEDNQAYHVSNVLNNIYDECDITPANHNPLVATESSVTHGCRGNVGESEMSENETNVDYSYVV